MKLNISKIKLFFSCSHLNYHTAGKFTFLPRFYKYVAPNRRTFEIDWLGKSIGIYFAYWFHETREEFTKKFPWFILGS